MSLKDTLVLVTGGGSGIGRETSKLAAKEGANVIVADINLAGAQETINQLQTDSPGNHLAINTDVSKNHSVDSLAKTIQDHYGVPTPAAIVHCAAIVLHMNGLKGATEEIWDSVIKVNLKGTYLVNRKFALLMRENGIQGAIVNLSSISRHGSWEFPEYAASKGGIVSFSQSIAKELGPWGIRCNVVAPGSVDTPFPNTIPKDQLDQQRGSFTMALGHIGKPEEIAEVCLFLISPKSSYVTGSVYDIDGGVTATPAKPSK